MAENQDGTEKKHHASGRRLQDAAERGQIAKSQDANALGVLTLCAVTLVLGSSLVGNPLVDLTTDLWQPGKPVLDLSGAMGLLSDAMLATFISLAAPLGAAVVGALAMGLAQSRGQLAPKALEPKLEKLDPIKGFKNSYMSWTPLVELGKGLGKLVLLSAIVAWGLYDRVADLPALAAVSSQSYTEALRDLTALILLLALPVVAVIAAADYAYALWKTGEDLKMTDEEVKRQGKEQDGDPHWKGKRRQRAREISMGSMIQALREADVLVVNPTHYAVALRYDRGRDAAPIVVAKGVDHLALHLKQKARELGVPQLEDRPLARALHARVKVGRAVPEDLYGPVARVLALIFRRHGEAAARRRAKVRSAASG